MQRVDANEWVEAVKAALVDGFSTFVTFMAVDDNGVELWLRLRNASGEDHVLATKATTLPTLIEVLPEASWCEREIAETFGVTFTGHETRALVLPSGSAPTMLKSELLDARQNTPWPGEKDPGGVTARRRTLPPGVAGGTR